ncbi:DUF5959 family protein [Nonomuraea sp. NPDC046802]|uniref:DUF5959 family protein n=1 Tax=Nonomuraea sp. NPDC046802 TaxID=3154919 RepID=UPI00340C9913
MGREADLDNWEQALGVFDALGDEREVIRWLPGDRGPSLLFWVNENEEGVMDVRIIDSAVSGAIAEIPIVLDDLCAGWIDAHRARLRDVRARWPVAEPR